MIDHIEHEIRQFLASDKAGVIVIKGDWGTGKTYAWNEWLRKAVIADNIKQSQYAYVSLFGCNALDELKAQTFQELIPVKMIPEGVNIDTVTENIKEVVEKKSWRTLLPWPGRLTKKLNDIPFLRNYSVDVWRLGWLTIKDTLICIDDIERIGEGLRVKDVYGLVSVLKEQKNCKVVLILNDENIKGDNKRDYEDYREKIVDTELHFSPETEDLVQLVFEKTHPHFDKISQCISDLQVKNIRTIQKIKTYLDKLSPHLKDVEDVYYENVINSIVLFTVLHFSKPDKWPTLDQVLEVNVEEFSMVDYFLVNEASESQDQSKQWAETMKPLREDYKWGGADEIDQLLGLYVKQGYIQPKHLQQLIEETVKDTERVKQKNEADARKEKVRTLLFSTYEENLPEIIAAIEKSLAANVQLYPALGELNEAVQILRKINQEAEAKKLITKYIKLAKKIGSNRINPDSHDASFRGPLDDMIISQIQKPFTTLRKKEMRDLLKNIDRQEKLRDIAERCPEHDLNKVDYEILSHFTPQDFETFLRNSKIDRRIRDFLDLFLLRSEPFMKDCLSYHLKIQPMLIKAVKLIANGSELNQYRLIKYIKHIETLEKSSTDKTIATN